MLMSLLVSVYMRLCIRKNHVHVLTVRLRVRVSAYQTERRREKLISMLMSPFVSVYMHLSIRKNHVHVRLRVRVPACQTERRRERKREKSEGGTNSVAAVSFVGPSPSITAAARSTARDSCQRRPVGAEWGFS